MAKVRKSRADFSERARTRGTLAAVVAARREELGLRQDELADLADVSVRFVHAVETGSSTVSLQRLLRLLDALGLHLAIQRGLHAGTVAAGSELSDQYRLAAPPDGSHE